MWEASQEQDLRLQPPKPLPKQLSTVLPVASCQELEASCQALELEACQGPEGCQGQQVPPPLAMDFHLFTQVLQLLGWDLVGNLPNSTEAP